MQLRPTFLAFATAALLGGAPPCEAQSGTLDVEGRVADLVGRMTLDEKVGQLHLASNDPTFDRGEVEGGHVGGVLAFTSARDIAAVQAVARRSRLGIPLLVGLDVVHGLRTMFPMPLAEAASFDPDLARRAAAVAAREAVALGVNWTFAPVADIARDPRWGRMIEGSGEDPLLGRLFTAARVRGFHDGGLATTLKHFAGYGAGEGGRDYDRAEISARDLFDRYLPPFRAGIEAGAGSVMAGFHALNGVPATANRPLLTETLREQWGFGGVVVSDWWAISQLVNHGVAADGLDAARRAFAAGVDMDMANGLYRRHLADEVRAGRIAEAAVTEAARRVVRFKLRTGLFERPGPDPDRDVAPPTPETRAAARVAARDTIVLLRNTGVLPLAEGLRMAVIGGMARSGKDLIGPHGALVRWEDGVTVDDAIRARAGRSGGRVTSAEGCDAFCVDGRGFDAAVAAAAAADVVVAVLGEPQEMTGEGASRARLTLPGRQAELLLRLVETGKPVVVVLLAGRPIELGPVVDRLAGLLMAWFPGTEGGNAVADLLFGDVEPSARLPVTWPRTVGQVPLTYDRLPTGRPHEPGNAFTLRYADEAITPLYPFGFGLGYARVTYGSLAVPRARIAADGMLEASVRLGNEGGRPAREVVQLYVRRPVSTVSRPVRQLKAFEKVALAPGETRTVTFRVPAAELGFGDESGRSVVEAGGYQVFVGGSSDAALSADFEVVADRPPDR